MSQDFSNNKARQHVPGPKGIYNIFKYYFSQKPDKPTSVLTHPFTVRYLPPR